MKKFLNISYGKDKQQKLDLYLQNFKAPMIFYIHGGGWWRGDKAKDQAVFSSFLKAGFSVSSINYRLLLVDKKNFFPIQIEDSKRAFYFLINSKFDFDRNKIGLLGSSSGAYIALVISNETSYPTVSWSGQFNFQGFLNTHTSIKGRKMEDNSNPDKGSKALSYYKWILEKLFNHNFSKVRDASLQYVVTNKVGPIFLINSASELAPLNEVYTMQEALIENGDQVSTLIFPGDRHAQDYEKDAIGPSINFFRNQLS